MSKSNKNQKPLISVIVASLNAELTLQHCLDSIVSQTYTKREIIVIDGKSSDGTVGILQKNAGLIAYWESQPDRGIYHAWNKAIQKAQGEYICFLGADDYWAKDKSLEELVQVSVASNFPDIISGKVALIAKNNKILRQIGDEWNFKKMKKWMNIAHPGMLHHKRVFEQYGLFLENFKIAGDYEFLLRLGDRIRHAFINDVIVHMGASGQSRVEIKKVFKEAFLIQAQHKEIGYTRATINYVLTYLKYWVRKITCEV
ncbi:glycosyltransferase [archaeon]|mgnify:CR=1 FL=1|jgi:glycosyltransferase involved in cell wall biosynthesis|nr:glycosyltransferase [archaeon]